MKLIIESWRSYLRENEQPDYDKYYISLHPDGEVDPTTFYEYPAGREEYGKVENVSTIALRHKDTDKVIMTFLIQRYQGTLGHSDIHDVGRYCNQKNNYRMLSDEEESAGCVAMNLYQMKFQNTSKRVSSKGKTTTGHEDYLYSAAFDVYDYNLSRPLLRSLSEVFREAFLSIIKTKYNGGYYGYHQAVYPGASTTKHANHVINSMMKKGYLKKMPVDYFKPKNRNKLENELEPFQEVEKEYTIFKITDKPQTKFEFRGA